MYQIGAIGVFVVGAVLLGVGTAGFGSPLIVVGILCVMAGGSFGLVASLDVRR
jgi:hypothetical protein